MRQCHPRRFRSGVTLSPGVTDCRRRARPSSVTAIFLFDAYLSLTHSVLVRCLLYARWHRTERVRTIRAVSVFGPIPGHAAPPKGNIYLDEGSVLLP